MRRVLLLGAEGQVGTALRRNVPAGVSLTAHGSRETDVRDAHSVQRAFDAVSPHVVINCAAFTRVDDAEDDPKGASQANAVAPGLIARACRTAGATFLHLSTDYVFDGARATPYAVDAVTAPINVYGVTKRDGEVRAMTEHPSGTTVVRTAWVHGGATSFVRTVVKVLARGETMRVIDDKFGTPTRAPHLADALWRLSEREAMPGILHFTDAGVASWYDVASAVHDTMASRGSLPDGANVVPVAASSMSFRARRPEFTVLDKRDSWAKLDWTPVHWRTGVEASTIEALEEGRNA